MHVSKGWYHDRTVILTDLRLVIDLQKLVEWVLGEQSRALLFKKFLFDVHRLIAAPGTHSSYQGLQVIVLRLINI